jgi:hypothetical protein
MKSAKTTLGSGVLAAVMALSVGCGGSSSSGPIPLADLPAQVTAAFCQANACGQYPDHATCVQSMSGSNLPRLQAAVAAGKTKYDGAAAAECLNALGASFASCKLSDTFADTPFACAATFTGTVSAGGDCLGDEECVSQQCDRTACDAGTPCCHGTCVAGAAPRDVPAGGACAQGDFCAPGTFCDQSAATPICAPAKAAGAPCMFGDSCVAGYFCLPATIGATGPGQGFCVKPPTTGQTCTAPGTCDLRTDFCDATTSKCRARIAVGGACDSTTLDDGCVGFAFCDQATSKCVAKASVGESCDPTTGSGCLDNFTCDANFVCQASPSPPVCR